MLTLVTGATGLLGNNITRLLIEQGKEVRVLVRENSDPRPLEGLDVDIVRGDVRNVEEVCKACAGIDVVIHAAGLVHIGWSRLDMHRAINFEGTLHIAQAARSEAAKMIHVSSVDALGVGSFENPADEETPLAGMIFCPYVKTKRLAEEAVLSEVKQGLDAVIVNPTFMIGPWDWKPSSGQMILEFSKSMLFTPSGGNNFCDVRDVAAGILTTVRQGVSGRRYILGGHNLDYLEAGRLMAQITRGHRPLCRVGPFNRWLVGKVGDFWGKISGHEPLINSASIAMSSLPHYFSSARAETELGYHARPLEESIRSAWDWFQEYGYA